jgi:hypothetical protein
MPDLYIGIIWLASVLCTALIVGKISYSSGFKSGVLSEHNEKKK